MNGVLVAVGTAVRVAVGVLVGVAVAVLVKVGVGALVGIEAGGGDGIGVAFEPLQPATRDRITTAVKTPAQLFIFRPPSESYSLRLGQISQRIGRLGGFLSVGCNPLSPLIRSSASSTFWRALTCTV